MIMMPASFASRVCEKDVGPGTNTSFIRWSQALSKGFAHVSNHGGQRWRGRPYDVNIVRNVSDRVTTIVSLGPFVLSL
jgi:hypothetical protein